MRYLLAGMSGGLLYAGLASPSPQLATVYGACAGFLLMWCMVHMIDEDDEP